MRQPSSTVPESNCFFGWQTADLVGAWAGFRRRAAAVGSSLVVALPVSILSILGTATPPVPDTAVSSILLGGVLLITIVRFVTWRDRLPPPLTALLTALCVVAAFRSGATAQS